MNKKDIKIRDALIQHTYTLYKIFQRESFQPGYCFSTQKIAFQLNVRASG